MGGDESRLAETSPDLMVPATATPATPYCDAEDEVLVTVHADAFRHDAGDRLCVHIDNLEGAAP